MRPLRLVAPLALALAALASLSACGGSSHHDGPITPDNPAPPPPPVVTVDAFYKAVLAIIGDGAETTTEPQATDALAATSPEDTEPVVLK